MKKTLLEMTQDILNEMDSDEVNSISDTVEAQQVAGIIKTCYNEMISNRNWPHLRKLVTLDSLSDLDRPNYLKLPRGMKELILFNYDNATKQNTNLAFKPVAYKEPDAFLRYIATRNSASEDVSVIRDPSGISLLIQKNKAPQFWTSFDDTYVVTDSYDAEVDDTLRSAKTQCVAYMESVWQHRDDAIPDLPEEAFAALEEEAKSTAFMVLKQMANQKAEQKAGRQNRWLARKAWRAKGGVVYPNYGRKR
jgi:hypothetical protein